MNESDLSFRQWLKRLRAERDLTQDVLADHVGCAAQTIRMFESGKRRPSRHMAERLADVLRVPPEERAEFVRVARTSVDGPLEAAHPRTTANGAKKTHTSERAIDATQGISQQTAPATQREHPAVPPILVTKLYIPRPRTDLVSRPRLLARLESGLSRALTLIAAPAGFGKTMLVADWLHSHAQQRKVAWLALEADDSSPVLFLRYLIAALQTIANEIGTTTANVLRSPQTPPIETLMSLLVNELVELPEPTILILDDYHVIDNPAVHQALAFLLDHRPPQLHLIMTTRADPPLPLARLRARGLMLELRAADLRFTPEEAATFLQGETGLTLTAEQVGALEARTEGWIVGLHLAALSLRDQTDKQRTQFIDNFAGSHRFVVDYLVDEVLARQPAHIQTFLLQTAVLDRLCSALCDAVMLEEVSSSAPPEHSQPTPYSQLLIEELERANLFIIPLDDSRRWYRYHHLFAQVLRERLVSGSNPVAVASLHLRASAWFEAQNMIVEAVQHALTARDWERVGRLIEVHGRILLVNGQVHTLLTWLDTLPDSLLHAHPYLLHLHALALFFTNQPAAAEQKLETVELYLSTGNQDERSRTILAYASLLRATIIRFRGDFTRCIALARQALETLPAADIPRRVSASMVMTSALIASGDVSSETERQLLAAIASGRTSADKSSLLNGIINLGALQQRQGRLREARATYEQVVQIAHEPGELQVLGNGAAYYFGMGDVLREWNELDAAEQYLSQGRQMVLGALVAEAEAIIAGYSALARVQQVRGDHRMAEATLSELNDVARQRNFEPHLMTRVAAVNAYLALLNADITRAIRWADSSGIHLVDPASGHREQEYVILARVRLVQSRHDPMSAAFQDVASMLDRWIQAAQTTQRIHSMIEMLVLRALAFQMQNNPNEAITALERALRLAGQSGYVRIFVDEGRPIAELLTLALKTNSWGSANGEHGLRSYAQTLAACIQREHSLLNDEPSTQIPLTERLTSRELEVLRMLAAGHSTQVIAKELVVAEGTVKRHVNNILSKLQVQSRLQAVARARTLNLL